MAIDVGALAKGQLGKLAAIRRSVDDELGNEFVARLWPDRWLIKVQVALRER